MREQLLICLKKMKDNPAIFKLDEAATKQCVILPILRALGWDVDNPEEVTPEYTVENKRVDYSLRLRNENKIFLEVKKTGEDLEKEKYEDQLLEYSFRQGVELSILTNGMTWWFYLPTQKGDWRTRKFYTIDIMEQEINSIVGNFIDLLAKNNVETGQSLRNAEALFEGKKRNEALKKGLPEAWSKLIDEPDPRLLDLLAETTGKICGHKPDTEGVKKFLLSIGNNPVKREDRSCIGEQPVSPSYSEKGDVFTCENKKGVLARGRRSSDGFIVLKGSKAILSETATIPLSAKKIRDKLRKNGILRAEGNFYIFTSDSSFNTPSAAAGVVLARSANGNIEWRNPKGQTLGQLVCEP